MSAPMLHHVAKQSSCKMTVNLSLRLLSKRCKLYNRHSIHVVRLSSNISHEEAQLSEEKDIFGINEFYQSNLSKENPDPGLDKQKLMEKYKIANRPKPKYDTVQLAYGEARLDPGVVDLFKKSEVENNTKKPLSRRKQRKAKGSSSPTISNENRSRTGIETGESISEEATSELDDSMCTSQMTEDFQKPQLAVKTSTEQVFSSRIHDDIETTINSFYDTDNSNNFSNVEFSDQRGSNSQQRQSQSLSFLDWQYFDEVIGNGKDAGVSKTQNTIERENTKQSFIEDQYFECDQISQRITSNDEEEVYDSKMSLSGKEGRKELEESLNFIDGQYFEHNYRNAQSETLDQRNRMNRDQECEEDFFPSNPLKKTSSDINEKENQFFGSQYSDKSEPKSLKQGQIGMQHRGKENSEDIYGKNHVHHQITDASLESYSKLESESQNSLSRKTDKSRKFRDSVDIVQPLERRQLSQEKQPKSTAEEAAKKIRKELNLESKAKPLDPERARKRQSKVLHQTIERMTSTELVSKLYDNIVFNRDDIIAINKPFGLASVDGPGVDHSVHGLLGKLKNRIDPELKQLHLISHLDKDTTGVLLLARTELMAIRLTEAFKKNEVKKKCLIVTKGVPRPEEGVVDIPMTEGKVQGKYRMVVRPYSYCKQEGTLKAITQYKVIATSANAAFVECIPHTSVKHQIRAHMFYGLNTPILGDHKYSHLSKMAPQKLYPDMLTGLKIRQAEVRYIPLHLHVWKLMIPEFMDGRNLNILCRIPDFFITNMKRLRLDFKKHL